MERDAQLHRASHQTVSGSIEHPHTQQVLHLTPTAQRAEHLLVQSQSADSNAPKRDLAVVPIYTLDTHPTNLVEHIMADLPMQDTPTQNLHRR